MIKDLAVKATVAAHALVETYEKYPFLALVSPYIPGLGTIDRALSKTANDFEVKQLRFLIEDLSKKVNVLAGLPASEDFIPTFFIAWDSIRKSKSREKIKYFSSILATTWKGSTASWDEISLISKLVSGLEDLHILILREANQLDPEKIFRVKAYGHPQSIDLSGKFHGYRTVILELCISDLISMGLVNDTVSGSTWGDDQLKPELPTGYSISPLGRWLLERIAAMASEEKEL